MRRIALICISAALILLPAATAAGGGGRAAPGFFVVRNAVGDGGVYGHPVVTVVVKGFVIGSVSAKAQARVDIYHLPSAAGQGVPQAAGADVSQRSVRWRKAVGKEYSGSGFRFRAIGGEFRVVIRGSGIYVFAGGHGLVKLQGSSFYPGGDGSFSVNGSTFRSLPTQPLTRVIGGG